MLGATLGIGLTSGQPGEDVGADAGIGAVESDPTPASSTGTRGTST